MQELLSGFQPVVRPLNDTRCSRRRLVATTPWRRDKTRDVLLQYAVAMRLVKSNSLHVRFGIGRLEQTGSRCVQVAQAGKSTNLATKRRPNAT